MRTACLVACAIVAIVLNGAGCVKPARLLDQDGRYPSAHDPNPPFECDTWGCLAGRVDVVDASWSIVQEGDQALKVVHVTGYTEMPDDSDVVLALRPIGSRTYKAWADVIATNHRFSKDLGPFTNAQLPAGSYVIEAKWLTQLQDPSVRARANAQDPNMVHRYRDMDMSHFSSKIVNLPNADLAMIPKPPAVEAEKPPATEGEKPPATEGEKSPAAEGTTPPANGGK